MSKPNKPGELRDVTVDAISLVTKAANGERFKIFKSANSEEIPPKVQVPENVKKDERGLFRILKEFFTGGDEAAKVEKGVISDITNAQDHGRRLDMAVNALFKVLGISRWGGDEQNPETNSAKIVSAIDDFRNVAIEIMLGKSAVEKNALALIIDRLIRKAWWRQEAVSLEEKAEQLMRIRII